jgi:hypothetical protein
MVSDEQSYEPTYRQQNVDSTLSNHESRISRLEKMALIGIGYGLAEGSNLVTKLVGFF